MELVEQLEHDGYAIVEGVLDQAAIARLVAYAEELPDDGPRGGRRNLLALPQMRTLASSPPLMQLVHSVLGNAAFPVRGILFDKRPEANWKVPWHQDLTIAVRGRDECQGHGPWSQKEGTIHVQPPTAILEQMLTVRLHLDDCPASNGALRVITGSHQLGRIDQNTIAQHIDSAHEAVCEVRSGGALLMRPLTIHASSVAESPRHRRVIHFDYACVQLADGLEWAELAAAQLSERQQSSMAG